MEFQQQFSRWRTGLRSYNDIMIRIREIVDPELRQKVLEKLAEQRGCSVAAIPDWYELDDADYVDLLNELNEGEQADLDDDPRM
jgi:hypothetical protein